MLLYYTKQLYTKYTSLLKAQVHRMRYTREAGIYIALCKLVYSKISNIESVSQFNHNRLFVKLFQQVSNAVSKSENWGWWLKTQGYKLKPIIYRKCLKWTFSYIGMMIWWSIWSHNGIWMDGFIYFVEEGGYWFQNIMWKRLKRG